MALSISSTFLSVVFLSNEHVSSERLGYISDILSQSSEESLPVSIFLGVVLAVKSENDCTDCRDAF